MIKERFGEKFITKPDECGDSTIRCADGFVYEGGDDWLGVWIETRRPVHTLKAIQKRYPTVSMKQNGDGECVLKYPIVTPDIDFAFLRSIGAHKRRELSDEHIEKSRERLARINADTALVAARSLKSKQAMANKKSGTPPRAKRKFGVRPAP